jgi:photosystem II stability/assembly factor-like uncharacterized protein
MPKLAIRVHPSVLAAGVWVAVGALLCQSAEAQPGTWSNQLQHSASLVAVKAVSENTGWLAGDHGTVLRTVNGGITWRSVGDTTMGFCWSIDAIDSNVAWLTATTTDAGGNASIFKTTNAGTSWTRVYNLVGTDAFLDCLKMFDASIGFVVGDPLGAKWVVAKTTDGGSSWVRLVNEPQKIGDPIGFLNILSVISATDIRFVTGGDTARIYRTSDGGGTWAWYRIPLPGDSYTQALKFNTPLIGVVGSSTKTLARTSDGGITWTPFTLPGPGLWGLSGYETTFFAANWYAVQASTNDGQTWAPAYSTNIGQLVGADFVKRSGTVRGWVIGASAAYSTIVSYYEAPTSVPPKSIDHVPVSTQLFQNYPNPFNPSTTISLCLTAQSQVSLAVHNVLGQEVAQLVKGEMDAGYHSVEFNGAGLPSGVYFYKLQAGTYSVTKRLLLVR